MKTEKELSNEMHRAAYALVRGTRKSLFSNTVETVKDHHFPHQNELLQWILDHPRFADQNKMPFWHSILDPVSGEDLVCQIAFDLERAMLTMGVVSEELDSFVDAETNWTKAILQKCPVEF